jgi:hypothetical protein
MNNGQSLCAGCGNNFCSTCQGYGWKTCPNKKLLHMLYNEGIVTEQSNLVRHLPPRRWPWDSEHHRFPVVEGYKKCGCGSCGR